MSENSGGDGNGGLYFIVGGLVVVVAVMGFFFTGGHIGGKGPAKVDVNISSPAAPAAPK